MRIALATHAFSWERAGGGEVMVRLLAEHLGKLGHEVHVLTSDARVGVGLAEGPFRVHRVEATTLSMRAALRKIAPGVLDVHNMELSVPALLAARSAGVPAVVTVNSAWAVCIFADIYRPGHGICVTCSVHGVKECFERRPPDVIGRRVPAVLGFLESRRRLAALRLASRIVAHSAASRHVMTRNGFPEERIRVVPNFYDETMRGEHAPSGERVLFVGGLTKPKGADTLVEAFAHVAGTHASATLDVAGDGYLRSELERRVRELRLEERVRFHGHVPRASLLDLYARAAVVVFPSRAEETFGRVVLEAWGTGAPVVATRVSAPGEIVRDGETGLLVDPEDPHDVARAIRRVLGDKALAERVAVAGRRELERYAPSTIVPKFVEVYAEAAAG